MKQLFLVTWCVTCNGIRRFSLRGEMYYCQCGEQRKINTQTIDIPKVEQPNRWDDMGCYLERET